MIRGFVLLLVLRPLSQAGAIVARPCIAVSYIISTLRMTLCCIFCYLYLKSAEISCSNEEV